MPNAAPRAASSIDDGSRHKPTAIALPASRLGSNTPAHVHGLFRAAFEALQAIRLAAAIVRATMRARRAPRLHVSSVEGRQVFGLLGAEPVELTRYRGKVEVYALDNQGGATFRGYAGPVLSTLVRSVTA